MLTYCDIIEDIVAQYPDFFIRYEKLAQVYYTEVLDISDNNAIPRAHCFALLELLSQAGYKISKVTSQDNVTLLTSNVLKFRKD